MDETLYELASHLHLPVYRMRDEMPYEEFLKWMSFFQKRPVGWREDQRVYMQLAAAGVKETPESLFPTLKALKDNMPAETKALPQGEVLSRQMKTKGGDDWSPPWLKDNK